MPAGLIPVNDSAGRGFIFGIADGSTAGNQCGDVGSLLNLVANSRKADSSLRSE
ncbi:MAG: hypothetical protein P4L10_17225 [Acidobacteriaceae bacterium]|jgi:hypothetical protein|nr:hypothetical protein [Acidobacteriaceae bacterium]